MPRRSAVPTFPGPWHASLRLRMPYMLTVTVLVLLGIAGTRLRRSRGSEPVGDALSGGTERPSGAEQRPRVHSSRHGLDRSTSQFREERSLPSTSTPT
jgi:hypothetical protein